MDEASGRKMLKLSVPGKEDYSLKFWSITGNVVTRQVSFLPPVEATFIKNVDPAGSPQKEFDVILKCDWLNFSQRSPCLLHFVILRAALSMGESVKKTYIDVTSV